MPLWDIFFLYDNAFSRIQQCPQKRPQSVRGVLCAFMSFVLFDFSE
ncbi:hypothetical protein HMPREF1145_0656 [Oribacterium parvum ACB8]|nr:hypothetical protein HMPREF1145_0656 [Oribacterium parvum ACB8]